MNPIVKYNDNLLDKLSIFIKIKGMSLFPFIILRERFRDGTKYQIKDGLKTINHETIHFQQALELLVIPFYILYVLEFLIKVIVFKGQFNKAYRNISFEREAYNNDKNFSYLKNRKRYNWIKLIF